MAIISDDHVEWMVVHRLGELLERPPQSPHDVTQTYSHFSSILCWTCQRMRAPDQVDLIWQGLSAELATNEFLKLEQVELELRGSPATHDLSTLPASRFIVALRNAVGHGDDRRIRPLHNAVSGADRRLVGFSFDLDIWDDRETPDKNATPRWGRWTASLSSMEMRRIGMLLAKRFCEHMSQDFQNEAKRHAKVM